MIHVHQAAVSCNVRNTSRQLNILALAVPALPGNPMAFLHSPDRGAEVRVCHALLPLAAFAKLNAWGYFDSAEDCRTQTEGLFVAGDCRSKRIRQVVTAASDGAVAAMAACMYLDQN